MLVQQTILTSLITQKCYGFLAPLWILFIPRHTVNIKCK